MSDAPRWRAFLNWCPRRQLGRLFWRAGVPGFDDIDDAPAELDAERVTESLDAFTNSAFADRTRPVGRPEMLLPAGAGPAAARAHDR
jgi:hypothetical protein